MTQAVNRRPRFKDSRVRSQVTVWDLWWKKWHCDRFFFECFHLNLSIICCFYQQNNRPKFVYLQKTELPDILENWPETWFHVVFLSITLIFYLLTCTHSSRTTRQTAKIVKILIMVLCYCGVVRCVSEQDVNLRYITLRKVVFISAVHSGEQRVSSFHRPHTRHYAFSTRWRNDRHLEQMHCGELHKLWHFKNY